MTLFWGCIGLFKRTPSCFDLSRDKLRIVRCYNCPDTSVSFVGHWLCIALEQFTKIQSKFLQKSNLKKMIDDVICLVLIFYFW